MSEMEMRLELIPVPVSDVDRAKAFYEKAGFNADHDHRVSDEIRFVQMTPPGSNCSISIGTGLSKMEPGSLEGLQMVVEDAEASRQDLLDRGVEASEVQSFPWGDFVYFSDPDGNSWALQQITNPDLGKLGGPTQHLGALCRRARGTDHRLMNKIMKLTTLIALVLLGALGFATTAGAAAKGPKLVQLDYSETDDGQSRPFALDAFLYRAEAVRFTTRYAGERATGEAKYLDHITDTNIHESGEARHPWSLIRKGDGRKVIDLIDDSLAARGVAKVRVRARGNGRHEDVAVEIRLAECSQDPPFYPVGCEIKV